MSHKSSPITPAPSAVVLVPPQSDWDQMAQSEATRFGRLLGPHLITVHHVGSTSIPDIWAKPVIDLMPEVHDITALDDLKSRLTESGYRTWGEYGLPGRRFCTRDDPAGVRLSNLHCYQTGSPELLRHLAFRDYLRATPDLAKAYEQEKLRARALHPHDLQAYNNEKNGWIRRVEREALAWYRG